MPWAGWGGLFVTHQQSRGSLCALWPTCWGDNTNTAPGNHSGKKKKASLALALAWKEEALLSHFWGLFFSSYFEGLHGYRDWGNSIRASTQLHWNPLTCRALLLGLAFVTLTSATPFGLLSSGEFRLHLVFLIFKSKYFCIEKHWEVPCCSCASRSTFHINLVPDKRCVLVCSELAFFQLSYWWKAAFFQFIFLTKSW